VPGCWFRGIRPAVDGLYRHPAHHRGDTIPPNRDALAAQQITQHPTTGKWVFEVQFIDPAHHREVGRRYRPGRVIEAATADPQRRHLAC
jgi:hypothetical protein